MTTATATATAAPRPRGRVAQAGLAAHETALLDAATALFLEHGFGGTSIDMLARAARVSPKTIYGRFGGKAGLFAAVMRRLADRALTPFRELALGDAPPGTVLPAFARHLLALVLSPDAVALQRAVTAEAARFPEFARTYYDAGPRRGLALLETYLRACVERGSLAVLDPALAAESFIALVEGELLRRAILNVEAQPAAGEIDARLQHAVRLFLAAHQARPAPRVTTRSPSQETT